MSKLADYDGQILEIDKLSISFFTRLREIPAVMDFSVAVQPGEAVGLVGESGCGKSTVALGVMQDLGKNGRIVGGSIKFKGRDLSEMSREELRDVRGNEIAMIYQEPMASLNPAMKIGKQLMEVPMIHEGVGEKEAYERALEVVTDVRLPDPERMLNSFPHQLSGGQQQRVGVARALAADPPVMLMDEPFGAIDPINREVIQDEFLKMQQELKKTIMFVSHDIDEAVKMADRIAIFRAGKLVQFDTPDDLLAHPKDNFVESFVGDDRALKRLRLVKVGQVMERPAFVTPQDNLEVALARIEEHGYHHAITMVNDKRQPIGYVTKAVAETTRGYCGEHYVGLKSIAHINDDLRKIASQMFTWDTTWLPCTDDDGTLRGYISQRGITHYLGATYHNDAADLSIAEPALAAVGR